VVELLESGVVEGEAVSVQFTVEEREAMEVREGLGD